MVKKKTLGRDMLMTFLYELKSGSALESSVEVKGRTARFGHQKDMVSGI
jgi:hypothetical protein